MEYDARLFLFGVGGGNGRYKDSACGIIFVTRYVRRAICLCAASMTRVVNRRSHHRPRDERKIHHISSNQKNPTAAGPGAYVFWSVSCQLVSLDPTFVFRGRRRCMAMSGFGTMAPDANRPRVTRTFVPSSKNRIPTRTGEPVTGSTKLMFE